MLSMFMALIDSAESQSKFEKIYYAYRKQMFYVANEVLQNETLAEEAVQEALLGIAKRIDHIRDDEEKLLRSYVLTAAHNAALYVYKTEQRNNHESLTEELEEGHIKQTTESVYISDETANVLKAAVRKLPELYQDVLLLKLVHEMSYGEIAQLLHRSQATVRQQVARGKKMLADICEKDGIYASI